MSPIKHVRVHFTLAQKCAVKHLEKVSLALSVQAASQKQAKVTEFFKK